MIKPRTNKKLPWKTYITVFVIWAAFMVPIGWSVWGAGPKEVNQVSALAETPGTPSGVARDQFLETGVHGIWVTVPSNDKPVFPLDAFTVLGPLGENITLVFPPGETIILRSGGKTTGMVAAFRVPQSGNYSIFMDSVYSETAEVHFGPAWEDGQLIDPFRGVVALIVGWLVTVTCAVIAFRATVSTDPKLLENANSGKKLSKLRTVEKSATQDDAAFEDTPPGDNEAENPQVEDGSVNNLDADEK